MVLDPSGPLCYCKRRGCWESLCAGPAIERQARETDLSHSRLLEMSEGDREKISARLVFEAACLGDSVAVSIVKKVSEYFALAILNIAILFAPDMIVLSGGVMRSVDFFLPRIPADDRGLQRNGSGPSHPDRACATRLLCWPVRQRLYNLQ